MRHVDILEGFYRDVWGAGDVASIRTYFDPDADCAMFDQEHGFRIEDLVALVEAVHTLVEEIEFRVVRSVTDGDWTAAVVEMRCVERSGGQAVAMSAQCMMRFRDGRIVEAYNSFDTLSFFTQVGVVPPDLTLRLLAGETAL